MIIYMRSGNTLDIFLRKKEEDELYLAYEEAERSKAFEKKKNTKRSCKPEEVSRLTKANLVLGKKLPQQSLLNHSTQHGSGSGSGHPLVNKSDSLARVVSTPRSTHRPVNPIRNASEGDNPNLANKYQPIQYCFHSDDAIPTGLQLMRDARVKKEIDELLEPPESTVVDISRFEDFHEEVKNEEENNSDVSIVCDV